MSTIDALKNYTLTPRQHGKAVWAHRTKPVWVAEYHRRGNNEIYFQTYVATVEVPANAKPWDGPNKRLGDEIHGFPTLAAAAMAGEGAC